MSVTNVKIADSEIADNTDTVHAELYRRKTSQKNGKLLNESLDWREP